MFRPNRLKAKLKARERAVGTWQFTESADAMEVLSLAGFDAVVIDHEHIAASVRSLVDLMRAAQATGMSVMVRVPGHDPVTIKRVLDAGVDGIVVPTLETADEARAIVAATRYRPHGGNRGVGYPETRAADWGAAEVDYPKLYRDRLVIAAIIETKLGMRNLPEIARVEGFDMLIPGPGDLAADLIDDFDSLGAFGGYAIPELDRLVADAEACIRDAGLALGGVARTTDQAAGLLARGYDFVTVSADIWFLADGARAALAALRGT